MAGLRSLQGLRRAVPGLLAWVMGVASATETTDCPDRLRLAFLDKPIPGMLAGEGQRFQPVPGRFVEWADETLRRLGCPGEKVRVPQLRLLVDTADDVNQVTFYFAYTPERAQRLAYPLRADGQPERQLALSETRLALFVRVDRRDQVQWDGRRLKPESLRVGIVGGGVEEAMAVAAGWRLDRALSHAGSVAKLRAGHVDVAVMPALSFTEESLASPPALSMLEPPLHRIQFFAPVSPALMSSRPQFVRRFWRILCEVARADPVGSGAAPSCATMPPS